MIPLVARELTRQFDADPVFADVDFDVRPGERIGLVGPNGSGKTTLLRILAGLDEPDRGRVEVPVACEVALLEQAASFAPERTLLQEVRSGLEHLYALQRESAELAERIASERSPQTLQKWQRRFDDIQQELHRLDAYNIDHRVDAVLAGLGFTPDQYGQLLAQLSGGQQNRALLARLLLRAPDVMLLDEPTNHLDIAATEWLEEFLCQSPRSMIIVSHDRYFLDRVTTRTFELCGGRLTQYTGNFSAYWRQREERNKVLERTYEKQQEFIVRTEEFIRRNKYGQKHAQAADREKKLARLERVAVPLDFRAPAMTFGKPRRAGDWVLEAVSVAKGYRAPLFSQLNVQVLRGERIGIFGPNGSGKTTLLKTLIGELPPDEGLVRRGTGVELAYFDQQLESVDPACTAIEAVRPAGNAAATPARMRELLARFGIRGETALQTVGSMSGGEKSKVALARLAALNANVLALDEPTNHLDLWARAALETALKDFDGTLLFVSHDRYFLDRIATGVIVLEAGSWHYHAGNYSDYVQFRQNQAREQAAVELAARQQRATGARTQADRLAAPARRKRKFPYRKVDDLEAEIVEAETLLGKLETDLADPDVHRDHQRARLAAQQYEETKLRLEQLYAHWEEAVELN